MLRFPISLHTPIKHAAKLPAKTDCVVIGGGVIGVSTALWLARAGVRVTLVEKGRIAGEQSSRNWGWIRAQGRDPAEIPITLAAQRLWRDLAGEVDCDIGLRQGGVAYLASSAAEVGRYENWMPHAVANGLDSRVLTPAQVSDLLPDAGRQWHGALWTAGDMRAEPWLAVPALARLAEKDGAVLRENCAARAVEMAAGKIVAVVTEAGRIETEQVVVAGGSWSSLLLRRLGISIPQLSVRATVAATEPMDHVFDGGAVDDRLAFRRREDGGYTLAPSGFHELYIGPDAFRAFGRFARQLIADPLGTRYLPAAPSGFPDAWLTSRRWSADQISPFEKMRILDPAPNAAKVRQLAQRFSETFPKLGQTRIRAAWAGMIDVMPDVVPVVDQPSSHPGLTIVTGMCGHGFGIGPEFGRIAADLVQGTRPSHDLTRFRLSRFSDGSTLELGPNL